MTSRDQTPRAAREVDPKSLKDCVESLAEQQQEPHGCRLDLREPRTFLVDLADLGGGDPEEERPDLVVREHAVVSRASRCTDPLATSSLGP